MSKTVRALLVGAAILPAACGTEKTTPGEGGSTTALAAPRTDDERTIYALGAAFGQRAVQPLRLSRTELAVLHKGIADTALGGQPAFEIGPFQQRLQSLAGERAAAAAAEEKERSRPFREQAEREPGAVKTASGLIYRTITPGAGASPGPESVVRVHYRGTLTDGTEFDSSLATGRPAEFRVDGVIPCWREGVQLMKVGEKARFVCPAELAYGDLGNPPDIPPGATLDFEVELLEIRGM